MKRVLAFLSALALWFAPLAFANQFAALLVGSVASTPSASYFQSDNFESGSAPTNWSTGAGSPDYGYATSPAPLVGTKSLRVWGAAETCWVACTFTASHSTCNLFFAYNAATQVDGQKVFSLEDAGGSVVVYIEDYQGKINVGCGGQSSYTVSWPSGTNYYWLEYVAGTGSNGTFKIFFSSSTTKPGSPNISLSGCTTTTAIKKFYVGDYNAARTDNLILDYFRASEDTIGSAP